MEDNTGDPPVRVQHRGGVDWRRLCVQVQRAQCIGAVHEQLPQCNGRRASEDMETPIRGRSEPSSQVRDGRVTEAQGGFSDCWVWSESAPNDVNRHGQLRRLSEVDKVREHVAHPPSRAPRRGVPRRLVERFDLIGELATKTRQFLPDMQGSHGRSSPSQAVARAASLPMATPFSFRS